MDLNMNNNNSKGVSYTSGFFLLIGFSLIATFIAGLIGLAILGDPAALKDPSRAGILRAIQVGAVVVGMLLPALAVARLVSRNPLRFIGYRHQVTLRQVGLVILILFVSMFVVSAFGYLNQQVPVSPEWKTRFEALEKEYNEQVAIMLNFKSIGGYILSLVIMAFLPALCEETLFRGGLQNLMSRATRRPWLAIIVVSILFSLAHFSFYLFLPRMLLGVMLGAIYYFTRNIWLSITVHFLNNALAVTQVYLLTRQGKDIETAMNSDLPISYWGLLALPLLVYLFMALKRTALYNDDEALNQTKEHGI